MTKKLSQYYNGFADFSNEMYGEYIVLPIFKCMKLLGKLQPICSSKKYIQENCCNVWFNKCEKYEIFINPRRKIYEINL